MGAPSNLSFILLMFRTAMAPSHCSSGRVGDTHSSNLLMPIAPTIVADATSIGIEIVRKFADQTGFVVHPRRWVVERTFAWLNRNRRLAKDFEQTIRSATTFLYATAAMFLIRRLARSA